MALAIWIGIALRNGEPHRRDEIDLAAMLFVEYGVVPSVVFAIVDALVLGVVQATTKVRRGWNVVARAAVLDMLMIGMAWVASWAIIVLR